MNDSENKPVTIIGGGLAGSEAAWQLAEKGIKTCLYEMRPERSTEAHETDLLGELVCSNSFKSDLLPSAPAILKSEMRQLGSLIIEAADKARVPAGSALAVDRDLFARFITKRIEGHPLITIAREEVTTLPVAGHVIIASGPLTSSALAGALAKLAGEHRLYFYDAISPVLSEESLDRNIIYAASRYGKGGGDDYLNIPLTAEEYDGMIDGMAAADLYPLHEFETSIFFDACLPIEELARRGRDTPRFGPMKPVGLPNPETGEIPHAVIQLRKENREGTSYNLVGCQTRMRQGEQKRIFRSLPGLARAEFLRYGSLHRNTYLCSPKILGSRLQFLADPRIRLAGQITGVEGYLESTAMGMVAAIETARDIRRKAPVPWPRETAFGALLRYIAEADPEDFQPTNINFGLFPRLSGKKRRKRDRNRLVHERAIGAFEMMLSKTR